MPIDVQLEGPWAGFSREGARKGENVTLVTEDFTSSEDGEAFFSRLEHGPDLILKMLPGGLWINRSRIDHLLIVFHKDSRATVYLDELAPTLLIRSRGKIAAGQGVGSDHIADVESFDPGIKIPDDAGVMFLFSVGWRKGFYFDFGPLGGKLRGIDLKALFGQFYVRVAFQDFFNISEANWTRILSEKWFPFIGLSHKTRTEMIDFIRAGWSVDDLTSKIAEEVKAKVREFLDDWEKHPGYEGHAPILRRAVERFLDDDFISCTGLLIPRIEGLMRGNHFATNCLTDPKQRNLVASTLGTAVEKTTSLLLPQRFKDYLEKVYFAPFDDPSGIGNQISRNSVGHGNANAKGFDQKSAVIAILVTHQLLFFLERPKQPTPISTAPSTPATAPNPSPPTANAPDSSSPCTRN